MRGKVFDLPQQIDSNRITPAYAGKSGTNSSNRTFTKDHPRLCGEKMTRKNIKMWHLGSPPPMRGKDTELTFTAINTRITPAYAGKSFRTSSPVKQ